MKEKIKQSEWYWIYFDLINCIKISKKTKSISSIYDQFYSKIEKDVEDFE